MKLPPGKDSLWPSTDASIRRQSKAQCRSPDASCRLSCPSDSTTASRRQVSQRWHGAGLNSAGAGCWPMRETALARHPRWGHWYWSTRNRGRHCGTHEMRCPRGLGAARRRAAGPLRHARHFLAGRDVGISTAGDQQHGRPVRACCWIHAEAGPGDQRHHRCLLGPLQYPDRPAHVPADRKVRRVCVMKAPVQV